MSKCAEEKTAMRTEVLSRRDALSAEVREQKSRLIGDRLFNVLAENMQEGPTLRAMTIAVYHAMRSEVSLDPFITQAYKQGAKLCFPCMTKTVDGASSAEGATRTTHHMLLRAVSFERYTRRDVPFALKPLKGYGIDDMSCRDFPLVAPDDVDIVIVPLVAFTDAGHRLGYGGGNYDRLLPRLRTDAMVLGVAFEEQKVDVIPCEDHDRKLELIVSA